VLTLHSAILRHQVAVDLLQWTEGMHVLEGQVLIKGVGGGHQEHTELYIILLCGELPPTPTVHSAYQHYIHTTIMHLVLLKD